ncbi:MAG TPA: EAL domain-containing protein [Hyphomicrobiales bacterium]
MKPLLARFSTRIRYKVLAAALTVAAVMGTVGWVAFGYVRAVTQSVAITTERTAPLLANASAASEASRRLVASARDADAVCAVEAKSGEQNSAQRWDTDFEAINRLPNIANSAGLGNYASGLARAADTLADTLSSVARVCHDKRRTLARLEQKKHSTLQAIEGLSNVLTEVTLAFDGEMTLSEENAKVALELGRTPASIEALLSKTLLDTWPMLRNLYKLRGYLVRLKDTVDDSADIRESGDLDSLATSRAESLAAMKSLIRRVSARLRALGHQQNGESLTGLIDAVDNEVKGRDGYEEARRALQLLWAEARRRESSLTQVETELAQKLKGLEDEARSMDAAAHAAMRRTINEALLVIGMMGSVCVLGTLLAALSFTNRLTRPIEALTAYAKHVQETPDDPLGLSPELSQRSDEIGRLALSFHETVEALAAVRRDLLAESRAEIRTQLERLKTAIEGMPQGIYLLGPDKRLLLCNSRFAELYDLTEAQVAIGTSSDDIEEACGMTGNGSFDGDRQVQDIDQPAARQRVRSLSDGRTIVVTTARTPDGGAVVVHEDITERRQTEAKITHMAHHDGLTGLANRVLFREQTDVSLARLRPEHALAVLCLDLDHFKSVNDALGHPFGDRLLVMASERLCTCLREHDHVARLGGDEFAVIMNSNPTPDDAAALAARIINTVGEVYEIDGQQAVIGVSIGIAMAPTDGTDADHLMKAADMALYRAKKDGRNIHCFFEPEMDARMQERRSLELALRQAVAAGGLELYYQPLIGMDSNEVEEFEALLRWNDPLRGQISPSVFIPLAEETGLINEIGAWVLKQACKDAASWPDHIRLAVNISPLQFRTRTLLLNVISALSAAGLPPHRLELEITEGVLLNDTDATLQILNQLHDLGVRIAMDDFGTGYSSLGYLRKFNFDKIKIDRSFVNELDHTSDSRAIIRAVSSLCGSLGIDITAEGVETEDQLRALRQEGCTQAQGYLLGRPAPVASVASYFEHRSQGVS